MVEGDRGGEDGGEDGGGSERRGRWWREREEEQQAGTQTIKLNLCISRNESSITDNNRNTCRGKKREKCQ